MQIPCELWYFCQSWGSQSSRSWAVLVFVVCGGLLHQLVAVLRLSWVLTNEGHHSFSVHLVLFQIIRSTMQGLVENVSKSHPDGVLFCKFARQVCVPCCFDPSSALCVSLLLLANQILAVLAFKGCEACLSSLAITRFTTFDARFTILGARFTMFVYQTRGSMLCCCSVGLF